MNKTKTVALTDGTNLVAFSPKGRGQWTMANSRGERAHMLAAEAEGRIETLRGAGWWETV